MIAEIEDLKASVAEAKAAAAAVQLELILVGAITWYHFTQRSVESFLFLAVLITNTRSIMNIQKVTQL